MDIKCSSPMTLESILKTSFLLSRSSLYQRNLTFKVYIKCTSHFHDVFAYFHFFSSLYKMCTSANIFVSMGLSQRTQGHEGLHGKIVRSIHNNYSQQQKYKMSGSLLGTFFGPQRGLPLLALHVYVLLNRVSFWTEHL